MVQLTLLSILTSSGVIVIKKHADISFHLIVTLNNLTPNLNLTLYKLTSIMIVE